MVLHPRFQVAIDKAAMKAGRKAFGDYIEEWRREGAPCGDDLKAEANAEATRLEAALHEGRPGPPRRVRRPRSGPRARGSTRHDPHRRLVGDAARSSSASTGRSSLIGERINPTGRKLLAEEMRAGDFSRVERDAIAQVEAGAHMLDVNAGIPLADEPGILARTIQLVQSLVDVPALDRLVDRRGARGGPRRLPRQGRSSTP